MLARDRLALTRVSALLAAGAVSLALVACGSSSGDSKSSASATTSTASTTDTASSTTSASPAAAGCSSVSAPAPKGAQHIARPTLKLDPAKRYVASLETNCGKIEIQLDVRKAPKTSASFAYLTRRGFYDNLTFHRVAAGFVIQGGDPDGDGSGGPGYTIVEPPPSNLKYSLGTVAMAKGGNEPSGASGSQFFIVTSEQAQLPAQYALLGKVVGSLAAVQAIAKIPTNPPEDGNPTSPVVISKATLSVN